MILFNRWIVARVDRAVKRSTCLTVDCSLPYTHPGPCNNERAPKTDAYAAKSYAFGVGPKPLASKRCRICQHGAHRIECRYENAGTECACEYVENPEYVQ